MKKFKETPKKLLITTIALLFYFDITNSAPNQPIPINQNNFINSNEFLITNNNIVLFTENQTPFSFEEQLTAFNINNQNSVTLLNLDFNIFDFIYNPDNERVISSGILLNDDSITTISSSISDNSPTNFPSGTNLFSFRDTPLIFENTDYLFYINSQTLFTTLIDGNGPAIRLSPEIPSTTRIQSTQILEGRQQIIFSVNDAQTTDNLTRIYLSPIDGSSPTTLLTELPDNIAVRNLTSDRNKSFLLNENKSKVIFSTSIFDEPFVDSDGRQIFILDLDKPSEAIPLSELFLGNDVSDIDMVLFDETLIYSIEIDGFSQLFSTNINDSENTILLDSGQEIESLTLSYDGNTPYIVYIKESTFSNSEVFSARIDGSSGPIPLRAEGVNLSNPFNTSSQLIVSKNQNVVFYSSNQLTNNLNFQVFSAAVDGSSPASIISPVNSSTIRNLQLSVDEQSIFYTSDSFDSNTTQLIQSNLDGSNLKTLDESTRIHNFSLSNDGKYIVYSRSDSNFANDNLFALKLENQEPPLCFPIKAQNGNFITICL